MGEIDEELLGVINGAMADGIREAANKVMDDILYGSRVEYNEPWDSFHNAPIFTKASAAAWQEDILNRPRAGCYRSPVQAPPTVQPAPANFRGAVQVAPGTNEPLVGMAYNHDLDGATEYPHLTDEPETVIDFTE